MSRDISARVVVVPRRDMDAREVYKGTRPPPPKRRSSEEATPSARAREGKRARGTDRGTTDDDEGARARGGDAFDLPSEDAGVDFSMKMWTEEGERVSKSRAARTQYDPETGPRIRRARDEANRVRGQGGRRI